MNKKEENKPPNKKLIIHFDINRTILLGDKIKGLSKDDHVIYFIYNYIFNLAHNKIKKKKLH